MRFFHEEAPEAIGGRGYAQRFEVLRVRAHERSPYQDILVFDTEPFGTVLVLDGIVQTTERDEFAYHEMLAHVPLMALEPRDVLVVGGGDGGVLREVLLHPVERVRLVEIDRRVVEIARAHLPSVSAGAFDDPRAEVVYADAARHVREQPGAAWDAILVDSPDPVGAGAELFTPAFLEDCRRLLRPGGVLVTQSGVPFFDPEALGRKHRILAGAFRDSTFYLTVVPTYTGGWLALSWSCDDPQRRQVSCEELARRAAARGIRTRYYSPEVHRASFALPPFVRQAMEPVG